MRADLHRILMKTVHLTADVISSPVWREPLSTSKAGAELGAEEAARPGPATGSWPWLSALMCAKWALRVATDESEAVAAAVTVESSTSYASDVLCRTVLEATSLAWWLLDPQLTSRRRVARVLLYRLHSAQEAAKATTALRLGPDEDRSGYWEEPSEVEQEIRDYGLVLGGSRVSWDGEHEFWPGYLDRVSWLVRSAWSTEVPEFPYRFLSAVAHAELLGLVRNFAQSSGKADDLRLRPEPFWIWFDAYLTVGALVLSHQRAADFLDLQEVSQRLRDWAGRAQSELKTLQPASPAVP